MQAVTMKIEPEKAKEYLKLYRAHRAGATADDQAIMRAYREIARGRVVIQAYESIRQGGFNNEGLPRLAIIRANYSECFYEAYSDVAYFKAHRWARYKYESERVEWKLPEFAQKKNNVRAIVPLIPLHLRPKSNLRHYHILWEAEWHRVVPRDPYLLRRLSGDLWLVVAAWDLTDVERAVLAARVSGAS